MYDRSFKKLASWTSDTRAAAVEYTSKYTGLYFVQITDLGIDPSCSAWASPDYSVAVDTSCAPNQYTKCSVTSGWVWGKR